MDLQIGQNKVYIRRNEKLKMTVLDQLKANNFSIDTVITQVSSLFNTHESRLEPNVYGGLIFEKDIEIETVFETESVTVTRGTWHKMGHVYPIHKHVDSIEYLICTQGKFSISFDHGTRLMGKGDCMSIPMGVNHTVTPLEDNSQIVAVCVPPELAYSMPMRVRNTL